MLGIGIDWAEEFHDVAFGTQEKGVIEQFRIDHGPAGVAALIERALRIEPDPAEVRVVLETRHGLLVEALIDAGFTVVPVNPDVVARRRGPARKKDDAEDARICCLLALDRHAALKALIPHGEIGGELRAIGRDDERAARDQRRLLNRLRADLQTTYPAALALAGKDLGSPTVLRLLERWPTQPELAEATHDELVTFARAGRAGWPERFADRVTAALAAPALPTRDYLVRAKAAGIRLAAVQLLALHEARRGWQARMAELLLGGPRTGRDHTVKDPDPRKAFPGGEIYLSMPGLGTCSPPGSAVRSANTSTSSTARPVCSATPVPHRSPADRERAISSSPAGWRTTTTSELRFIDGPSAASCEVCGPASSTTARSPPERATTPRCGP